MFFALSLIMSKRSEEQQENEIRVVPIHQMKVQLPLENWHDVLAFVPRSQLGNVVSKIGDNHFTRIIQSFLHDEVRKITLGEMEIIPPRPKVPSDQPMVRVWPNEATNMPDWPMPGNIKDFKQIKLNYLDASVLHFLGKFQENALLTDVNMHFDHQLTRRLKSLNGYGDILPRALTKIVPFITSINSIDSLRIDLFEMLCNAYHDISHESQLLLKEMMEKTQILNIDWSLYACVESSREDKMGWCRSWLYTPMNDGKPRVLRSYNNNDANFASFIERIKKDFEGAKQAVSFFIYSAHGGDNFEDISFYNVETNEKLVIKMKYDGNSKTLLISRYPLEATKNWIETNEKEIAEWNRKKPDRKIILAKGLTIGNDLNIVHSNQIILFLQLLCQCMFNL